MVSTGRVRVPVELRPAPLGPGRNHYGPHRVDDGPPEPRSERSGRYGSGGLADQLRLRRTASCGTVLYPPGKGNEAWGCWGVSGFYAALLRTVNIPVRRVGIDLDGPHSRPSFVSIDRQMVHGDDVYTAVLTPSGGYIFPSELLYTTGEFNKRFVNPPVDCANNKCNTSGQQAAYNTEKAQLKVAVAHKADYLRYKFSKFGPAHLDDDLRGFRVAGGLIVKYAKPYFIPAERATMISAIEQAVREVGDSALATGKTRVIKRYDDFHRNKE